MEALEDALMAMPPVALPLPTSLHAFSACSAEAWG